MLGLYIHIPFCVSKCLYCDFNSYADKMFLAEPYINAVLKEAQRFSGYEIDTVYIGGGTPTALPCLEITRLISGIKKTFKITADAEFTVEMNPGTAGGDYLKALQALGVNRISMGAQSFDDILLKKIGRIHCSNDIFTAVRLCKEAGFENYSLDLMFSLPGQTLSVWSDTLKKAVSSEPSHISAYGLKIEPGTPFYERGVKPLSDSLDREMYHLAIDFFKSHGLNQYEISNFAIRGRESRHNLKYWHCEEYIGLGAGAHGFIPDNGKKLRYANIKAVESYINKIGETGNAVSEKNFLTENDIKTEKIIMGLRLTEGVPQALIPEEKANFYMKNGFMKKNGNRIRFSEKGFDVSNTILSDLI